MKNKGQFLFISRFRGLNGFSFQLQFKEELFFENDRSYEIEFQYIINDDVCDTDSLSLTVFLMDPQYFIEILFQSNSTLHKYKPDRWNKFNICFYVLARNYQLFVNATSLCEIDNNNAFIALDNFIVNPIDDNDRDCLNLEITVPELPTIETEETTTIDKVENTSQEPSSWSTSESTTTIVTTTSTPDISDSSKPTNSNPPIASSTRESTPTMSPSTISNPSDTLPSDSIPLTVSSPSATSSQTNLDSSTTKEEPELSLWEKYSLIVIIVASVLGLIVLSNIIYCIVKCCLKKKRLIHPGGSRPKTRPKSENLEMY